MENLQHQFNRYFVDNGATEWWLTGLKTTLLVTVIALCIRCCARTSHRTDPFDTRADR